jgi:hypothetical protein
MSMASVSETRAEAAFFRPVASLDLGSELAEPGERDLLHQPPRRKSVLFPLDGVLGPTDMLENPFGIAPNSHAKSEAISDPM